MFARDLLSRGSFYIFRALTRCPRRARDEPRPESRAHCAGVRRHDQPEPGRLPGECSAQRITEPPPAFCRAIMRPESLRERFRRSTSLNRRNDWRRCRPRFRNRAPRSAESPPVGIEPARQPGRPVRFKNPAIGLTCVNAALGRHRLRDADARVCASCLPSVLPDSVLAVVIGSQRRGQRRRAARAAP